MRCARPGRLAGIAVRAGHQDEPKVMNLHNGRFLSARLVRLGFAQGTAGAFTQKSGADEKSKCATATLNPRSGSRPVGPAPYGWSAALTARLLARLLVRRVQAHSPPSRASHDGAASERQSLRHSLSGCRCRSFAGSAAIQNTFTRTQRSRIDRVSPRACVCVMIFCLCTRASHDICSQTRGETQ